MAEKERSWSQIPPQGERGDFEGNIKKIILDKLKSRGIDLGMS